MRYEALEKACKPLGYILNSWLAQWLKAITYWS
jgi:hypothetical protein